MIGIIFKYETRCAVRKERRYLFTHIGSIARKGSCRNGSRGQCQPSQGLRHANLVYPSAPGSLSACCVGLEEDTTSSPRRWRGSAEISQRKVRHVAGTHRMAHSHDIVAKNKDAEDVPLGKFELHAVETRMKDCIKHLQTNLMSIRIGRANPGKSFFCANNPTCSLGSK